MDSMESDECASLSSTELNNDLGHMNNPPGTELQTRKEPATLELPDRSLLMMKMLANRANAKWVEALQWTTPHVYDPSTLVMGRADIRIYKQLLIDLLQEGKVTRTSVFDHMSDRLFSDCPSSHR